MNTIYIQRDERFQPNGVAVYLDVEEARAEFVKFADWTKPEEIESSADEFVAALEEVETEAEIPEGYYSYNELCALCPEFGQE